MNKFTFEIETQMSKEDLANLLSSQGVKVTERTNALYLVNLMYEGHLVDVAQVHADSVEDAFQMALLLFQQEAPYGVDMEDGSFHQLNAEDITVDLLSIETN